MRIRALDPKDWVKAQAFTDIPVPVVRDHKTKQPKPDPDNPDYKRKLRAAIRKQSAFLIMKSTDLFGIEFSGSVVEAERIIYESFMVDDLTKLVNRIIKLTMLHDPYTMAVKKFDEKIQGQPKLIAFMAAQKKKRKESNALNSDPQYEQQEALISNGYTVAQWEQEEPSVRADLLCHHWEKNLRENYQNWLESEAIKKQSKRKKK